MAHKKKHEEHENHERWLVSYADFITLLFAFFVVMYAVSRVDVKKAQQVAQSVRFAMHFEGTGGVGAMPIFDGPPSEGGCAANPGSGPERQRANRALAEKVRRKLERRLSPYLQERLRNPTVRIETVPGRLALRLAASRFFDPSQAALRPEVLPVLDAIAAELSETHLPIRVEGHTDDTSVGSGRFRNNWELSASRAVSVLTYLQDVHRIPPQRLAAVGYGSTRPVNDGLSPDSREENRRIELIVELDGGPGNPAAANGSEATPEAGTAATPTPAPAPVAAPAPTPAPEAATQTPRH